MRQWRPKYSELSEEERFKSLTRSYTRVYVGRGKIILKGKCEQCGSPRHVERHHIDYSQPLIVKELCRGCHKRNHQVLINQN